MAPGTVARKRELARRQHPFQPATPPGGHGDRGRLLTGPPGPAQQGTVKITTRQSARSYSEPTLTQGQHTQDGPRAGPGDLPTLTHFSPLRLHTRGPAGQALLRPLFLSLGFTPIASLLSTQPWVLARSLPKFSGANPPQRASFRRWNKEAVLATL